MKTPLKQGLEPSEREAIQREISESLIDEFYYAVVALSTKYADIDRIKAAKSALHAALATPPEPMKGWVRVPVEPTREMMEAPPALPAIRAVDDLPLAKAGWSGKAIMNLHRYRAMLEAAPKA